jgi:[acyl-carrier-protein] S-malonyltransferase
VSNTAFLFPGQGSQSVGMGQDLHQEYDIVREIFDMAEEITRINLRRLCFKGPMESLTETVNLQPALTAVNLGCLAVIGKESGGVADVTAGHSLGEYSALAAADVISQVDAVRLVFRRGELMHREALKHRGAMAAVVGLDIDAVAEVVARVREADRGPVSVANHNTAQQIVITGAPDAVSLAGDQVSELGARAIPLKVSGAWHSELIRGAMADLEEFLSTAEFSQPRMPVIHNVTAEAAENPDDIPALMARQLCSPVRWYDSMQRLYQEEVRTFVEVGPGRVLAGLLKKILPKDSECRVFNVNGLRGLEAFLKAVS